MQNSSQKKIIDQLMLIFPQTIFFIRTCGIQKVNWVKKKQTFDRQV